MFCLLADVTIDFFRFDVIQLQKSNFQINLDADKFIKLQIENGFPVDGKD